MARYSREFLVPYLHNLCVSHLAIERINRQIAVWDDEIRELSRGIEVSAPEYPQYEAEYTFGRIVLLLLGGFVLFLSAMVFIAPNTGMDEDVGFGIFVMLVVGAFGAFLVYLAVEGISHTRAENEKKLNAYHEWLEHYEKAKSEYEKRRAQLPRAKDNRAGWVSERNRVRNLLKQAYAVNVIPKYYRELYPAVYLYNWFRYSQEDDLAMALNMFVLEEIKSKLDQIINNQSEIILNQYIQEANQRRAMEQNDNHQRQLMRKLDQISDQNDERNTYLKMIESTVAADAYFSAADYLRDL